MRVLIEASVESILTFSTGRQILAVKFSIRHEEIMFQQFIKNVTSCVRSWSAIICSRRETGKQWLGKWNNTYAGSDINEEQCLL